MTAIREDAPMCVEEELRIPFGEHETWVRRCVPLAQDSAKAPVIVLHGGPGAAHNYLLPVRELPRVGREVIFYDQLRYGNSTHLPDADPPFWTPELFITEFTTALGLDPFTSSANPGAGRSPHRSRCGILRACSRRPSSTPPHP